MNTTKQIQIHLIQQDSWRQGSNQAWIQYTAQHKQLLYFQNYFFLFNSM